MIYQYHLGLTELRRDILINYFQFLPPHAIILLNLDRKSVLEHYQTELHPKTRLCLLSINIMFR